MAYVVYSIEFFGVEIQAFFCLNWFFPSLFPSAPSMGQFFLWMRLLCEVSIMITCIVCSIFEILSSRSLLLMQEAHCDAPC